MKQKMVLILSVVCGIIAFILTSRYLESEKEKLYRGAEKIQVLAAARDLPVGTVIDPQKDLGVSTVFKSAVGENVCRVEDVETLRGKKVLFPLRKKDPINWSYIDMPDRGRAGLASMIKPGMRAVSISVSGASAVSGLVQPGDRVDILGTFTFPSRKKAGDTEAVTLTVLQDVSILATGPRLAKSAPGSSGQAGGYSTVTLEVTMREAEMLVFAQHVKGQLLLTLRNEEDLTFEKDLPEVDFQQIEQSLPELNQIRQRDIRHKKGI